MDDPTPLDLIAGQPIGLETTIPDGKDIWPARGDFEVRCQARRHPHEGSTIVVDFTPLLVVAYDGNDILITLDLTGSQTRALPRASGHYDMWISDVGVTDGRAWRLLWGPLTVTAAVTSAS